MKTLAKSLLHRVLLARRNSARWMWQQLSERARGDHRPSLTFRVVWPTLNAVYFVKRLLQSALSRAVPTRWDALRQWQSMVQSALAMKINFWADYHTYNLANVYERYRQNNRATARELVRMRQQALGFVYRPLISVVVPVYNSPPEWLARLALSVCQQTYDRWELVFVNDGSTNPETRPALDTLAEWDDRITVEHLPKNGGVSTASNRAVQLAHGEFLAFADHDDELLPDALWYMVDHLQHDPRCDVLYSDEEIFHDHDRARWAHFKSGYSPEMLSSYNYICHLAVVRRQRFEEVGGFRSHTDGAQDFDLLLRLSEVTDRFHHIPRVLYRWRMVPVSLSRRVNLQTNEASQMEGIDQITQQVVQEHLDRRGELAQAEILNNWALPRYKPVDLGKVSIVILTKENPNLLQKCISSIEEKTNYPNYEIVVVDTGHDTEPGRQILEEIKARHRVVYRPNGPEGFNFAKLNNELAREVDGKWLLMLNDDTEVLSEQWMSAMVAFANRPGVGAVGARLLFPDRLTQHCGVIMGAMGFGPWHALWGVPADQNAYGGWMTFPHNALAATGACLLTSRELFLSMEGFDHERFGVGFNDVDYCLRLRQKGLRTAICTQAELIHYEGKSRGRSVNPQEALHLKEKYDGIVDPYWNANYSRLCCHFTIDTRRQARLPESQWPCVRVLLIDNERSEQPRAPHHRSSELLLNDLVENGRATYHRPDTVLESQDPDQAIVCQRQFENELSESAVDVVLAEGQSAWPAVRAAHQLGIPVVWKLPELVMLPKKPTAGDWFQYTQFYATLPLAYQVIVSDQHSFAWMSLATPQVNLNCVSPVPPAFSDDELQTKRVQAREMVGIDDDQLLVLAEPRFESFNDLKIYADAWKKLEPQLSQKAQLLLAIDTGTLDYRQVDRLRQWVRQQGPNLQLMIRPDESELLPHAADLYLALTLGPIEAERYQQVLTAGIPIIGTQPVHAADCLVDDLTGRMVPSYSPKKLAQALNELGQDETLRNQMSRGSKQWAQSRASQQHVRRDWHRLLVEASEIHRRADQLTLTSPKSVGQPEVFSPNSELDASEATPAAELAPSMPSASPFAHAWTTSAPGDQTGQTDRVEPPTLSRPNTLDSLTAKNDATAMTLPNGASGSTNPPKKDEVFQAPRRRPA